MLERLLASTGIPELHWWMILFGVTLVAAIYFLKMTWWVIFIKPKLSAHEAAEIKGELNQQVMAMHTKTGRIVGKEQPNDR